MRTWGTSDEENVKLSSGRKPSSHEKAVGHLASPTLKKADELQQSLFETASDIDDFTHNAAERKIWLNSLLVHLEFFARADDPNHPEQFLLLLERIDESIKKRINQGTWE